jgi:hypothetical protein
MQVKVEDERRKKEREKEKRCERGWTTIWGLLWLSVYDWLVVMEKAHSALFEIDLFWKKYDSDPDNRY